MTGVLSTLNYTALDTCVTVVRESRQTSLRRMLIGVLTYENSYISTYVVHIWICMVKNI